MSELTIQEMFDRAVRGLASQGWERSQVGGSCLYTDEHGRHCAWGWVDPLIPPAFNTCSVGELRDNEVGLAARLLGHTMDFARTLQYAHDGSHTPEQMLGAFVCLTERYALTWPEDVPRG